VTGLRLGVVALLMAMLAFAGTQSNVPTHLLVLYLAGLVVFLAVVTVLQNRYTEGVREGARDRERLYRPNELSFIVGAGYVQWGVGAVCVPAIGFALSASSLPSGWFIGGFLLAVGLAALRTAMKRALGAWAGTRLRLRALTHQSFEVVLITEPSLSTRSIEATAEYSRTRGSHRQGESTRTDVLWKGEASPGEARRVAQHCETELRFVMPASFTQGLELSEHTWDRGWHLRLSCSPTAKLNFNFKVPPPER
jgi:hypothetical protein